MHEDMFPGANSEKDLAHARTGSVSFTTLSSDLDDVPEEEEAGTTWHDSPESNGADSTSARTASRLGSPAMQPDALGPPRSRLSVFVSGELSEKFSEALGSPTLPQFRENAEALRQERAKNEHPRRQSSFHRRPTYETIYESWDADIDYCYEHAAESNSNFDWARKSLDEPRHDQVEVSVTVPPDSPLNGVLEDQVRPSVHHLSTSTLPTLDLDPSPSRSLPSASFAATPSTAFEGELPVAPRDGDYFQPVSSSMFPSTLGKHMTQDTLYDEYLAADAESDRHFSFCSQGVIRPMEHPVSPRSSFSPISKCNSEESLILSRAASIVRKHRSSVSTASVPDLVHSLANSRELPLMDHVSSSERLSSGSLRPDSSSHHRQAKSLARELEAYRLDSNATPESTGPSVHDRAKSTSEVEAAPLVAKATKASAHRRKGRTSYSLFPIPPTAN
jgi:RNA polymerase-associated protein CTR9